MQLNRSSVINKREKARWTLKLGSSRPKLLVKRIYGGYLGYKTKILFSWKGHKVRRSPSVLSTPVAVTYGMMIPRAQSTHKVYMPLRYVRSYVPYNPPPRGKSYFYTYSPTRVLRWRHQNNLFKQRQAPCILRRSARYTYSFRLHKSTLRTK